MADHRSSCQIRWKDLASWTCKVVSGVFTLGEQWGWNDGQSLYYKMVVDMSEAQKPAMKGCAGSLIAEMKQNLHCGHLDCLNKQQHWILPAQTLAST